MSEVPCQMTLILFSVSIYSDLSGKQSKLKISKQNSKQIEFLVNVASVLNKNSISYDERTKREESRYFKLPGLPRFEVNVNKEEVRGEAILKSFTAGARAMATESAKST